ncbi:CPCC family cysteine-rich protein [Bacillus sp. WMMC1349]|uniref:CPCC family cysteine-rich protein n=1 Tax=Bacillus sp. WMMC1349 TaxID=2736254 RepID=UPI0020A65EDB|nr:CPCC family cysteine-rich protein [Bacillus sp. WMMC1349]
MKREKCPCCGFPTIEERRIFEICELCNWEDDGQDDPNADEVWGGQMVIIPLQKQEKILKNTSLCIEIVEIQKNKPIKRLK